MKTIDDYYKEADNKLWTEVKHDLEWERIAERLCQEDGWYKITISRFRDNHHAIDIRHWAKDNCRGNYDSNGATYIFERESDAALFALRWL